jgi:hypothetical protein
MPARLFVAPLVALCAAPCAALFAVLFATLAAGAERGPERVERGAGADRFVAGNAVVVAQPVDGDLIAAGGEVDVEQAVGGDAVLAGGRVRLDASAGQNLYAAGGRVEIDATVERNARVAGGSVQLGPRGRIRGNASLAGGRVNVLGAVDGYLQVGAGRVLIDAPVAGDVEAAGRSIELGPNARIAGRLRYRSERDLVRDPKAQVIGGEERLTWPDFKSHERQAREAGRVLSWLWTAGLMLLGVVLVAGFPRATARVTESARQRLGWSLLVGFLALVAIPPATAIAAFTVIGLPVAVLVLLLYLVLLLVGFVAAGVALGDAVLGRWSAPRFARTSWRAVAAAIGVLVLALLARVPYVGAFVALLALLVGVGAVLMSLRRYDGTRERKQ